MKWFLEKYECSESLPQYQNNFLLSENDAKEELATLQSLYFKNLKYTLRKMNHTVYDLGS